MGEALNFLLLFFLSKSTHTGATKKYLIRIRLTGGTKVTNVLYKYFNVLKIWFVRYFNAE